MTRTVIEVLECRILNPDAAGVVVERLGQEQLGQLVEWFMAEDGGGAGSTILLAAPIFDTLVQRCVDGAGQAGREPRLIALALFGSGLGIAAHWLGGREEGSAFSCSCTLAEMVCVLASYQLPERLPIAGADEGGDEDLCDPVALMQRLCAIDARVDVVVQAVLRIAFQIASSTMGRPCCAAQLAQSPVSRLLLFAGMLAAGLVIPGTTCDGDALGLEDEQALAAS